MFQTFMTFFFSETYLEGLEEQSLSLCGQNNAIYLIFLSKSYITE